MCEERSEGSMFDQADMSIRSGGVESSVVVGMV